MPPQPSLRGSALSRLCVLALAALVAAVTGCSSSTDLVVTVTGIPSGSKQLRLLVRADDTDAQEQPRYELPADPSGGFRIGLRLPETLRGSAIIAVAALNGTEDRACILATTSGSVALGDRQVQIALDLQKVTTTKMCASPPLVSLAGTQEVVVEQGQRLNRIRIDGWGFLTKTQVLIDNMQATGVINRSGATLYIDSPDVAIPTGSLQVKVELKNPSGESATQIIDLIAPVFSTDNPFFYRPVDTELTHYIARIAAGDVNGDKLSDLVIIEHKVKLPATLQTLVHLFISNGTLPSAPVVIPVTGMTPTDVSLSDLNNDGKAELIVAGDTLTASSVISVMAYGNGSFSEIQRLPFLAETALRVWPGRFRGQPQPDVFVGGKAQMGATAIGKLYLLSNDGTGRLQTSTMSGTLPGAAKNAAAGDFNGDGRLDIVIADAEGPSQDQYRLYPIFNNAMTDFPFVAGPTGPINTVLNRMAAVDLNKDGKADLILSSNGLLSSPAVLFSGGTAFSQPDVYGDYSAAGMAAADFNGDGATDLALADLTAGQLRVLYNTGMSGAGLFFPKFNKDAASPGLRRAPSYPTVANNFFVIDSQVVSADVNGDGRPDLIVSNPGDYIVVPQHGSLQLFLNTTR